MRALILVLLTVFVSEKGWAATQDAKPNDLSLDWTINQIAPGTKPALAVDSRGLPGIIYMLERSDGWVRYLERTGETSGRIKYAHRSPGSEWEITKIDALNDLFIGFAGARNLTSLALDSSSNPWIAYSDERELKLAVFDSPMWRVQTISTATDNPFGQIVSLKLDQNDSPHLAFATVTAKSPLAGFVFYATAQSSPALVLRDVRVNGGNLLFSFDSVQGRSYAVQYKNALNDPAWIDGESVTGNGSEIGVSVSTLDSPVRFYRVIAR